MNKNILISILILVGILIIGGIYVSVETAGQKSAAEQTVVKNTVTEFGQQLKMVSLLAPAPNIKESMDTYYSDYVAPEVLSGWESNPSSAPGRVVSSPYPDNIAVSAATKNDNGTYSVTGIVTELTSVTSAGGVAATYPVLIKLENRNGIWLITAFERGPYTNATTT